MRVLILRRRQAFEKLGVPRSVRVLIMCSWQKFETMGTALRKIPFSNGLPLPVEESNLERKSSEMVPGREFGVSRCACAFFLKLKANY